jgi:hypothetical protein
LRLRLSAPRKPKNHPTAEAAGRTIQGRASVLHGVGSQVNKIDSITETW